jgi:hypothetical protein
MVARVILVATRNKCMATYSLNGLGGVPFTGYTSTLGSGSANQDATSGVVAFNGITQGDERIAKMLRNGGMSLVLRRLLQTLVGAAPGSTATQTKKQIQWQQGSPGGVIPIETVTLINRATTAADVTALQALLVRTPTPPSYPADLSGNGGGGKQTAASGSAY